MTVRRVLQSLLSAAVVAVIFFYAFPKIADFSQVWSTIAAMTWLELATLAVAAVWNLATYWLVMMAVLPGLAMPQAMIANLAGGAIANSVPAGGAVGVGVTYRMFSSWGFTGSQIGLSVLLSGVWNNFIKLGLPVVSLALLAVQGQASTGLLAGALAGVGMLTGAVVLFALMLRSRAMAYRVGSWLGSVASAVRRALHKSPVGSWGQAAVAFRSQTIGLLRRRWLWLTTASLGSHLALYLVLLLALRHVGVSDQEVGWAEVLGAFAFMRLISALPITPGGLGVVELGATAALILAGGDRAQVVAAVLVYRALTWLPIIPLGAASYLYWRHNRTWRRPAAVGDHAPA